MPYDRAIFGEPPTRRETQVAIALLFGRTRKETAQDLGISIKTMEIYRQRLYIKYGARGYIDLIRILMGTT